MSDFYTRPGGNPYAHIDLEEEERLEVEERKQRAEDTAKKGNEPKKCGLVITINLALNIHVS